MDLATYLDRITYHGPLDLTAATLRALHVAHLQHVPFENLDIHQRRPFGLEPIDLYDKIVIRRRGGFCYELNGLFALLLEQLGFTVTRLMAQVLNDGVLGPEFDHLTLRVPCPAEPHTWLADVGFLERTASDHHRERSTQRTPTGQRGGLAGCAARIL